MTAKPPPQDNHVDWRCEPYPDVRGPLNCFPLKVEWLARRLPVVFGMSSAPKVPARALERPEELAGGKGNTQGMKMGRLAVALGWTVKASYWKSGHDVEGCAVGIQSADGVLRAVALWKRSGDDVGTLKGWAADMAYAWRTGTPGTVRKISHTELLKWLESEVERERSTHA